MSEPTLVAEMAAPFMALGVVRCQRMFGGHGIWCDGIMVGLVADDTLYLKADAQSVPVFEAAGLAAFTYTKNGKTFDMSYRQAPDDYLDDPHQALVWAERALAAARRAVTTRRPARRLAGRQ